MSIPVTCPSCGAMLDAPDSLLGREIECGGCGESLTVRPSAPARSPARRSFGRGLGGGAGFRQAPGAGGFRRPARPDPEAEGAFTTDDTAGEEGAGEDEAPPPRTIRSFRRRPIPAPSHTPSILLCVGAALLFLSLLLPWGNVTLNVRTEGREGGQMVAHTTTHRARIAAMDHPEGTIALVAALAASLAAAASFFEVRASLAAILPSLGALLAGILYVAHSREYASRLEILKDVPGLESPPVSIGLGAVSALCAACLLFAGGIAGWNEGVRRARALALAGPEPEEEYDDEDEGPIEIDHDDEGRL